MKDVTQEKQLQKKTREDFLVELFDKSFPGLGDTQPTYE
jgi:hypothetical protein